VANVGRPNAEIGGRAVDDEADLGESEVDAKSASEVQRARFRGGSDGTSASAFLRGPTSLRTRIFTLCLASEQVRRLDAER
jgi:hypothetical protein